MGYLHTPTCNREYRMCRLWTHRTVALYLGRDAVYAESAAGNGTSLLNPALNTWYNVQLTLNLNTNTYSGLITGHGGATTVISPRSFVTENRIDCIFTDYGTAGAFPSRTTTIKTPSHEIDNFAIVPEPSTLVHLGPALIGMIGCIVRRRRSRGRIANARRHLPPLCG